MMNPYGNYSPAEALRDTSLNLRDLITSFGQTRAEEAKANVELARVAAERARYKLDSEKELALAELGEAKDRALLRKGERELDIASEGQDLKEREHLAQVEQWKEENRLADLEARREAEEAQSLAALREKQGGYYGSLAERQRLENEKAARLQEKGTMGDFLGGAEMSLPKPMVDLAKGVLGDRWDQEVTREDAMKFIAKVGSNPKIYLTGLVSQLGERLKGAKKELDAMKQDGVFTPEEQERAKEIMEVDLVPAATGLQTMKILLGEGEEITEDERKKMYEVAKGLYVARVEAGQDATLQGVFDDLLKASEGMRKTYWSGNAEEMRDQVKAAAEEILGGGKAGGDPIEEMAKSYNREADGPPRIFAKKIENQLGKDAANKFLSLIGEANASEEPTKKEPEKAKGEASASEKETPSGVKGAVVWDRGVYRIRDAKTGKARDAQTEEEEALLDQVRGMAPPLEKRKGTPGALSNRIKINLGELGRMIK